MDGATKRIFWLGVCLSIASAQLIAADFSAKVIDKVPPKEVGDSIRSTLQAKAIEIMDGEKPAIDLWLRQEVPLKSKPASATAGGDSIAETTVLGAVSVNEAGFRDYKDNEVPKGVFIARYALQPQDGDHLGTAEFNFFLALLPADVDKTLDGIKEFKPMVKTSGKLTSSGHPLVLSLRPASGDAKAAAVTEPAPEHKAVRIALDGNAKGEKTAVAFDLVFQGHGHIQ